MDTRIRLTRKPVTTALWGILAVAMSVFLCIGTALWFSTANLAAVLDEHHAAVAYRKDRGVQQNDDPSSPGIEYTVEDRNLTEQQVDQLAAMDSVKGVHFHTLSGGYSPSFEPVLGVTNGVKSTFDRYHLSTESYREAMIVGTVERVHWLDNRGMQDMWPMMEGEMEYYSGQYLVNVEQIVLIHDSYQIETAIAETQQINVFVQYYGEEASEYVQPGQRYVFYGDYDPDQVEFQQGVTTVPEELIVWTVKLRCGDCFLQDGILRTPKMSMNTEGEKMVQAVAKLDGTLEEFLADPANALWVRQMEDWQTRQHSVPVLGTPALDTFYLFMKHQAELVEGRMFTESEYDAGSRVCILSDSLAERSGLKVGDTFKLSQFSCIEENESVVDDMEGKLNNPTIGSPIIMPEFVTEDEEFTVVGLYKLRDEWVEDSYAITPNTVFIPRKAQITDTFGGPNQMREQQIFRETLEDDGTVSDREIVTEMLDVENGAYGIYLSIELENGKMEDFLLEINQDPVLQGQFHTVDMGLEKAFKSIEAMDGAADKLLVIVVLGWFFLLALYAVLYQGSQRQNLGIMRSLGASPKVARSYLFGSGMGLAAAGVAVGGCVSLVMFDIIQNKLTASTLAQVDKSVLSSGIGLTEEKLLEMVNMSQVSPVMLLLLCAAQIAVIAAVLWLHAFRLSRRKPRELLGV